MPKTIYSKLALVLALLLLVVGLIYTLLTLSSTRFYLQEIEQQLSLDLAEKLLADNQLIQSGKVDQALLEDTFFSFMVINPSIEIYLLDDAGKIISYAAEPGKVVRTSVDLEPIHELLSGKEPPVLGDDPRSLSQRKVFSVAPLVLGDQSSGYLYVVLRGEQYDDINSFFTRNFFRRQSAWALTGGLLAAFVAGLLLFYKMTRRLNSLSEDMDNFRSSNFTQYKTAPIENSAGDEIDRLQATFSQMASRMNDQLEELRQKDQHLRELIANVSHDLKTPVAILRGYLETLMMKGEDLREKDKQDYLELALRSSEHLSDLIRELFDLARLDARQITPNLEQFNIAELANDSLLQFQLQARNKHIELSLQVDDGADCYINADIGLIARVFENLLSNAIKHTPHSSSVSIAIEDSEHNVTVRIKDNGVGLDEMHLSHVFDRFYQPEKGNASDRPGGIGLAICRKIMELHGGNISAESQPGEGCTFSFTLCKSEDGPHAVPDAKT